MNLWQQSTAVTPSTRVTGQTLRPRLLPQLGTRTHPGAPEGAAAPHAVGSTGPTMGAAPLDLPLRDRAVLRTC